MQLVFVLVCFLSVGVVVMACPDGILVRKEYRDMTKEEWETFKSTFLALQSDPSPDGKQYSELDYWANLHATHGPKFHG